MSGTTINPKSTTGFFQGISVDQGVEDDLQQLLADSVIAVTNSTTALNASDAASTLLQSQITTGATQITTATTQGLAKVSDASVLGVSNVQAAATAAGVSAASTVQTAAAQAQTTAISAINSAQITVTGLAGQAQTSATAAMSSATSAGLSATSAAASAAGVNLPATPASAVANMLRVNATHTGYELRTPAQVLADIGVDNEIALKSTGFRNLVVNGNFDLFARGAYSFAGSAAVGTNQSASYTPASGQQPWVADRWYFNNGMSNTSVALVAASDADRAAVGNSLSQFFSCNIPTGTKAANDFQNLRTRLEGPRLFAGRVFTLSFWVQSSAAQIGYDVSLNYTNSAGAGGSYNVISTAVGVTGNWTRITSSFSVPTIPAANGFVNDGLGFLMIRFWFSAGSNNSSIANVGAQTGTFNIAQVQVEPGFIASPFEIRPYAIEQSMASRYFQGPFRALLTCYTLNAGNIACSLPFQPMRSATPTITTTFSACGNILGTYNNVSSSIVENTVYLNGTSASSGQTGINQRYILDAEL